MKRKRPSNSEFCDMSEATAVSISQSSSLAPVTPRAPVAAADTTRIANAFWMIPHAAAAGTPTAAPTFAACSNQQIRALSPSLTPVFNDAAAWSISPFVASTNFGNQTGVNIAAASVVEIPSGVEFRAPSLVVASTSVGVKDEIDNGVAPSASSGSGSGSGNACYAGVAVDGASWD
ncbi:hypothetical protein NC652_008979 [Populus alba x Populus x berolinensis]|nr:hypothetical protein NC652_008979 [Populus alba x Populus x berolinensis]